MTTRMNDEPGTGNEIPSGEEPSDYMDLRQEVAGFLGANKERLVGDIDRVLKKTVHGYDDLPAEVFEDVRQSFRELLPVSYTHLRAHETRHDLVCRLLLE